MRLLLDEMISFRIAAELRDGGHDVQAVKRDRPDLESLADLIIVQTLLAEQRAIVTNNVRDYRPIHDLLIASGRAHAGMVFTFDSALPRTRAAIPHWVRALGALLDAHPADDALASQALALVPPSPR